MYDPRNSDMRHTPQMMASARLSKQ